MEIRARHGMTALIAALALHVAVAAAWLWESPPSGARTAGTGGISVSLGPAGGAPGAAAPVTPDVTEAQPVQTTRRSTPPPPAEPVRPAQSTVAEAPPVARRPELPREQPAKSIPVETVAVAEPTPAQEPPPPPPAAATPGPKQQPAREPPVAEAEPAEEVQVARTTAGAGGRSGTRDRADTGTGDATAGGGLPGRKADYMALLQAWLEKHKEYPRRAQLRRQQGTAMLYFVMDRDGRVLEYRLRQSSGHRLLDQEVVAMIERAQPLPEMPEEMHLARLELVVPVQFQLR